MLAVLWAAAAFPCQAGRTTVRLDEASRLELQFDLDARVMAAQWELNQKWKLWWVESRPRGAARWSGGKADTYPCYVKVSGSRPDEVELIIYSTNLG
jgi:hypothetical protein